MLSDRNISYIIQQVNYQIYDFNNDFSLKLVLSDFENLLKLYAIIF